MLSVFCLGSGIFSPVGSNLSVTASRQLHHPAEVTAATNTNVHVGINSPKTHGVTTANVRSSAARALTDLNTAPDVAPDTSTRSSSDTAFSGSLAPSITRTQFERNQRKGSAGEYADSQAAKGSLYAEADEKQAFGVSPPGSLRNGNRVTQPESTVQAGKGVCIF